MRMWGISLNIPPDYANGEELAREFEEAMGQTAGTSSFLFIVARIAVAYSLEGKGEFVEAKKVLEGCISILEQSRARESTHEMALEGLARSCLGLELYAEAVPPLSQAIVKRLQAPEPSWCDLYDLAILLETACMGMKDSHGVDSALDLSRQFMGNMTELGVHKTVVAHIRAFSVKRAMLFSHGKTPFHADQVVGHIDMAVEALIAAANRRDGVAERKHSRSSTEPTSEDITSDASQPSLPARSMIQVNGWRIFDLFLHKAIYISRCADHERAVTVFEESKTWFEECRDIGEHAGWIYFDNVWIFLDCEVESPQDIVGVPATITWACSQARRLFGSGDEIKQKVREGIRGRPDLLRHLPEDESFCMGLAEEAATATGAGQRQTPDGGGKPTGWFSRRKLPVRLSHRRQFSAKRALMPSLTVAAAMVGVRGLHVDKTR
jgi:hypothetical protein